MRFSNAMLCAEVRRKVTPCTDTLPRFKASVSNAQFSFTAKMFDILSQAAAITRGAEASKHHASLRLSCCLLFSLRLPAIAPACGSDFSHWWFSPYHRPLACISFVDPNSCQQGRSQHRAFARHLSRCLGFVLFSLRVRLHRRVKGLLGTKTCRRGH